MSNTFRKYYYSIREICYGSGYITLLSISIITLIVYILFLFFENREIIPLLIGTLNKNVFASNTDYVTFLESLNFNRELTILIPILCTIILLVNPANQLKSNTLNRILPIAAKDKVISFLIIILGCTIISNFIIVLLDCAIIQYLRSKYLNEVLTLQESIGELYKYRIKNGYLFSADYSPFIESTKRLSGMLILSLVFNTLILVFNLLFHKYSIIKGISLIVSIVFIAFYLRNSFIKIDRNMTIDVTSYAYETVYYIYFPILFICLILSFYFLLKQKEN